MVIHLSKRTNCCSVYMNKTLYGYTPNENSLLDLDRSYTHIHNIDAKRCKVNNDSATYLWHCRLGHIGVKRMKKLHADGLLESLPTHIVTSPLTSLCSFCNSCFELLILATELVSDTRGLL